MSSPAHQHPDPQAPRPQSALAAEFGPEQAINISQTAPRLLKTLFLHHDGIVLGATIAALTQIGILAYLVEQGRSTLQDILARFPGNAGYLHVALRCLALQGWLSRRVNGEHVDVEFTELGQTAALAFPIYAEVGGFIYSGSPIEQRLFAATTGDAAGIRELGNLTERCVHGWRLPVPICADQAQAEIIRQHLDGLLIGPIMIALKRRKLLDDDHFPPVGAAIPLKDLTSILALFEHQGWIETGSDRSRFTAMGKLACQFTLHYGLTLSYWPMFCRLSQLISHTKKHVTHAALGQEESHVDRTLNVLASGVAHRRYFEDSDQIIKQIFNQEPLAQQPRFVADMGCGDGAWLQRIYEVVRDQTLRGRHLREHPLLMVGADFNAKAVDVVEARLNAAQVPHLTLFGDITDPSGFAQTLQAHGLDSREGLHIRAFIDHNRRYSSPEDLVQAQQRKALSSGAYVDEHSQIIPNNFLEQNLVEHFRRWVPYVEKHGLIVIEAHNVPPEIAAQHSGKIHATAFDTYHGFSNQYPVDFDAFMDIAEEAGLRSVLYQQKIYPTRLPFVAISLNRFKSADPLALQGLCGDRSNPDLGWRPDGSEDLRDGEALHRFLYRDGDHTRPARWCYSSTGELVAKVLAEVEQRLASSIRQTDGPREITAVDYGAGTGLASLELIKGLNEKALIKRCQEHQVRLRLLLVDLPSSWFAKAYELLHGLPLVEFHSLRDPHTQRIRPVSDFIASRSVDVIIASMVFHLIPPKALPIVAGSLSQVLKPQGLLAWNTPDTGPTPPMAELIHVGNRALRRAISELLDGEWTVDKLLRKQPSGIQARYKSLPAAIASLRQKLSADERTLAKAVGQHQILAEPTSVSLITGALAPYFTGEPRTALSPLSDQDLIDLALLPANQRYFSEIPDPTLRRKLTEFILRFKSIPELHSRTSGRLDGVNLHWTAGYFRAKP